jgi:hypothetical protein
VTSAACGVSARKEGLVDGIICQIGICQVELIVVVGTILPFNRIR